MALLDAAVAGDVDARPAAHLELGEVVMLAYATDLFPYLAAAGENPFVGWGGAWHGSTLPTA